MLSRQANTFFQGQAEWFYYYQYHRSFDVKFIRELRKEKWIYINDSKIAPIEITFEELPNEYKDNISSAKNFANVLHFRLDEDKEYERNHQGKRVVDASEWEELQKLKAEKEAAEKAKRKTDNGTPEFKPSVSVADAPMKSSVYAGKDTSKSYNENQYSSGNFDSNANGAGTNSSISNGLNTSKDSNTETNNAEYIKDVGRWGEEYVYRVLQNEFEKDNDIEIVDLNSNGNIGVGADFEIRKDGIIFKLIEVKSTTNSKGNPVIVSGTQWETARRFYKLGDGDKYWIYCVYNVGTENVQVEKVQDPIKQWKDGKIVADPINFVLQSL
ncbi:hypothetical protein FACS189494_06770 [Spirochaetia bacterium]|nr:hypothetical protein FACS189494_06770 [Spirochaetia bacterium]